MWSVHQDKKFPSWVSLWVQNYAYKLNTQAIFIIAIAAIHLYVCAGIDMHSVTVVRLSLFLSLLQCYLIVKLANSELILIIVLPQSVDTEVSASWERGEEILPAVLLKQLMKQKMTHHH